MLTIPNEGGQQLIISLQTDTHQDPQIEPQVYLSVIKILEKISRDIFLPLAYC